MANQPLLYITDNMLKYWAIWYAASYSSLLDIFLPLLCCTVSSYCTHSLHFRPVPSPSKNVLLGYVFTFSEKWVPLRDVFKPIPLRFLMWIMITKGRLGFQPILSWCCLCRFSLSNFIRCLPASMCLCRLQKTAMLSWIPVQGRRNTLL